jgi:hypothetical protein
VSDNPPVRVCSNSACRVSENGKCVEGLTLEACQYFGRSPPTAEIAAPTKADENEAKAPHHEAIPIPSAELIEIEDARRLARANTARLIALVGASESGKTSLLASLFDQFQKGPLEGYSLRQCVTLHGFERASHHSRVSSRRDVPYTERTPLGSGLKFYHLGLQSSQGERVDLLLADRPGEDYRSASDDPQNAASFIELTHADSLTLLIDGERLSDPVARHNTKAEVDLTLQGLVESGIFGPVRRLAVVLTKLDTVVGSERSQAIEAEFDGIVGRLTRKFGHCMQEIVTFKVAASPNDIRHLPHGHGVSTLFNYWIGTGMSLRDNSPKIDIVRFFHRFKGE